MKIMKYKNLLKKILILLSGCIVITQFYHCPIRLVFGVQCPGCGMTRAFISVAQFRFYDAFAYHPLYPLFLVETVYIIFRSFIFKYVTINKKIELAVGLLSILLLLVVWMYKKIIL